MLPLWAVYYVYYFNNIVIFDESLDDIDIEEVSFNGSVG